MVVAPLLAEDHTAAAAALFDFAIADVAMGTGRSWFLPSTGPPACISSSWPSTR